MTARIATGRSGQQPTRAGTRTIANDPNDTGDGVPLQADGSINAMALGASIFGDSSLSVPFPAAAHAGVLTATGHAEDVPETLDALLDRCGIRTPFTAETLDAGLRSVQFAARGFDALRTATLKAALADRLKTLKVARPTALVDLAFPSKAPTDKTTSPTPALVPDTQPWPEPVDGAAVLDALLALVLRYVVITKAQAIAMALWVLHTFTILAWEHSPICAVVSPTRRCGKSTLLSVAYALVYRPLVCANVTPAVVFRLIEAEHPTLLLDEADTWLSDEASELRGIVNSGHAKTTAVVARCVGDEHEVATFSTWAPKLIAMIGRPPATILDRSIVIAMRRKAKTEAVRPLRSRPLELEALPIRQQLRRWADDHLTDLAGAEPAVPDALNDRQADSWRPLLALADDLGGAWPEMARQAALTLSGQGDDAEDDALPIQLLTDIRTSFEAEGTTDHLETTQLLDRLKQMQERPWEDYGKHGKGLNAHGLSRMLRPFDIDGPLKIRVGAKTVRGYRRDAFSDAWNRYCSPILGSQVEQVEHVNISGPEVTVSAVEHPRAVPLSKGEIPSMNPASVPLVPLPTPEITPGDLFSIEEASNDERF